MSRGERWLQVGSIVLGAAVALGVGWWLLALQMEAEFWTTTAFVAIALGVLGSLCVVVGLVLPSGGTPSQVQRGGAHSTNLQAGRDIKYGGNSGADG